MSSEAGIDTKIFKGHSTRSALTSKAGLAGLSVNEILEALNGLEYDKRP